MNWLMPLKEETAEFDFAVLWYSKRRSSANQEEGFHQTLYLLVPWSWDSQAPELSEICVLFKPPRLWYSVRAAWANWDKRPLSLGVLHGWHSSKFPQKTNNLPHTVSFSYFLLSLCITVIFPQGDNLHSPVSSTSTSVGENIAWRESLSLFFMNDLGWQNCFRVQTKPLEACSA